MGPVKPITPWGLPEPGPALCRSWLITRVAKSWHPCNDERHRSGSWTALERPRNGSYSGMWCYGPRKFRVWMSHGVMMSSKLETWAAVIKPTLCKLELLAEPEIGATVSKPRLSAVLSPWDMIYIYIYIIALICSNIYIYIYMYIYIYLYIYIYR